MAPFLEALHALLDVRHLGTCHQEAEMRQNGQGHTKLLDHWISLMKQDTQTLKPGHRFLLPYAAGFEISLTILAVSSGRSTRVATSA